MSEAKCPVKAIWIPNTTEHNKRVHQFDLLSIRACICMRLQVFHLSQQSVTMLDKLKLLINTVV